MLKELFPFSISLFMSAQPQALGYLTELIYKDQDRALHNTGVIFFFLLHMRQTRELQLQTSGKIWTVE